MYTDIKTPPKKSNSRISLRTTVERKVYLCHVKITSNVYSFDESNDITKRHSVDLFRRAYVFFRLSKFQANSVAVTLYL